MAVGAARSSCTSVVEAVFISDLTKSFGVRCNDDLPKSFVISVISEGFARGAPVGLSRLSTGHELFENYSYSEIIDDDELIAMVGLAKQPDN